VNTTSTSQAVSITSSGEQPLKITTISVTGDYAETDNCATTTLNPSVGCLINVTFTPTAGGTRNGTLTINDNALNSPQTVPLTGQGGDFTMALNTTSATVTAGNPASTTIILTPVSGYTQTVTLTCTGAPTGGSCGISPSSVTLDGVNASTATLNISTSAKPAFLPPDSLTPTRLRWLMLLAAVAFALLAFASQRKRRVAWLVGCAFSVLLSTGCGTKFQPYTPAGIYTVTVTATAGTGSGAITQTAPFSLTVQ
jgi:hypothetical protein